MFPSYPKVINLGNPKTENALIGEVIVQCKIDGSQFRVMRSEDGIKIGTRRTDITETPEKLFIEGWEYIQSIKDVLLKYPINTCFYFEYLSTPKHNTLKYDRVPKNHLVLFDCIKDGKWVDRDTLVFIAMDLGVDVIPQLYKGIIKNIDELYEILNEHEPWLGGDMEEGLVIKNYNQEIDFCGKIIPLFTKLVQDKFKEKHQTNPDWASKKDFIQLLSDELLSDARYEKSYQRLRDEGKITGELSDIGLLMKEVSLDIIEEEKENIMVKLWNKFGTTIVKNATKGIPNWYKEKLLKNVKENDN